MSWGGGSVCVGRVCLINKSLLELLRFGERFVLIGINQVLLYSNGNWAEFYSTHTIPSVFDKITANYSVHSVFLGCDTLFCVH